MTKIAVIYYSLYGHTKQLADTAAAAANLDSGVEASVFQVSVNDSSSRGMH